MPWPRSSSRIQPPPWSRNKRSVGPRPRRPGSKGFVDDADAVRGGVEARILREKAEADAAGGKRLPKNAFVDTRHDAQQRALAGAVGAEHADLGAEVEREPDVVENLDVGRM